jgi:hypothetical protein
MRGAGGQGRRRELDPEWKEGGEEGCTARLTPARIVKCRIVSLRPDPPHSFPHPYWPLARPAALKEC